jgi:hypothetical protein
MFAVVIMDRRPHLSVYNVIATNAFTDATGKTTTTTITSQERETHSVSKRGKTRKTKWRAPTPYSIIVESGNVATYEASVYDKYKLSTSNGKFLSFTGTGHYNSSGGFYQTPPIFPSNMEDTAITKARLKLKNQQVNLGNAFGERAQCARLVGDTAIRIANLFSHVKRRNFWLPPNKRPKPIDVHKAYLELQYGVKPLMSDVYGTVSTLENKEKDAERGHVTVKASVKSRNFTVRKLFDGFNNTAWGYDQVLERNDNGFIRLDFVQDNPLLASLNSLGVTNPIEIAWELTPYSFVADWFFPIGDWLNSLDATLGWRFKGGSFSAKSTRKIRVNNAKISGDVNKLSRTAFVVAGGSGRQMCFDRTVYSDAPMASLPSFYKLNKSSVDHATNGIALLATVLAGFATVR